MWTSDLIHFLLHGSGYGADESAMSCGMLACSCFFLPRPDLELAPWFEERDGSGRWDRGTGNRSEPKSNPRSQGQTKSGLVMDHKDTHSVEIENFIANVACTCPCWTATTANQVWPLHASQLAD